MKKFHNLNITKLEVIAPVWAARFNTTYKISFFKGAEANKPYVLLFEVKPKWKPKTDFVYEICNSFSKHHQSLVGTRTELIETCTENHPKQLHAFMKKWYIFVKFEEEYFSKNYDYSTDYISDKTVFDLGDYSSKGVVKWNKNYFDKLVSLESEQILYPTDSKNDTFESVEPQDTTINIYQNI